MRKSGKELFVIWIKKNNTRGLDAGECEEESTNNTHSLCGSQNKIYLKIFTFLSDNGGVCIVLHENGSCWYQMKALIFKPAGLKY